MTDLNAADLNLSKYVLHRSTDPILIGDENPALLIVEAENRGEGAYETELYITLPPHTHYQGVVSNREVRL